MTQTSTPRRASSSPSLPRQRSSDELARESLAIASARSAFRAALAGLVIAEVIVLVLWAADTSSGSSASQAARAGLVAWAWAHHAVIHVSGGVVGFTPPALLALPVWLSRRSARRSHSVALIAAMSGREALRATLLFALPYAALAAGIGALAHTQGIRVDEASCAGGGMVLSFLGAGSWCMNVCIRSWWRRAPLRLQVGLRAGTASLTTLVGAGAAALVLSLIWHFSQAVELNGAVTTSAVGGLGLVALCISLIPAAVVWSAAVAAGPGFSLGVHTSVTAGAVHLGSVPAISLLAALPASGSAPLGARLLPVAAVLAGVAAGAVLHRQLPELTAAARCGWGLASGLVTGLGIAVLCLVSSGPVAPGRLDTVGASAWKVGLAAAEESGLIAAIVVALLSWKSRRTASW